MAGEDELPEMGEAAAEGVAEAADGVRTILTKKHIAQWGEMLKMGDKTQRALRESEIISEVGPENAGILRKLFAPGQTFADAGFNPFKWLGAVYDKIPGPKAVKGIVTAGATLLLTPFITGFLGQQGVLDPIAPYTKMREGAVDEHYSRLPRSNNPLVNIGRGWSRYWDKGWGAIWGYPSSIRGNDAANIPGLGNIQPGGGGGNTDIDSGMSATQLTSAAYAANSDFQINPNDPAPVVAQKQALLTKFLTTRLEAKSQQLSVALKKDVELETDIRSQLYTLFGSDPVGNRIRQAIMKNGYRPNSVQDIAAIRAANPGVFDSVTSMDQWQKLLPDPTASYTVQAAAAQTLGSIIRSPVEAAGIIARKLQTGNAEGRAEVLGGQYVGNNFIADYEAQNKASNAMKVGLDRNSFRSRSAINIREFDSDYGMTMKYGITVAQNWNAASPDKPPSYLSVQDNTVLAGALESNPVALAKGANVTAFIYKDGKVAWTTGPDGKIQIPVRATDVHGKTSYGFISKDDYTAAVGNAPDLGVEYTGTQTAEDEKIKNPGTPQRSAAAPAAPAQPPAAPAGGGTGKRSDATPAKGDRHDQFAALGSTGGGPSGPGGHTGGGSGDPGAGPHAAGSGLGTASTILKDGAAFTSMASFGITGINLVGKLTGFGALPPALTGFAGKAVWPAIIAYEVGKVGVDISKGDYQGAKNHAINGAVNLGTGYFLPIALRGAASLFTSSAAAATAEGAAVAGTEAAAAGGAAIAAEAGVGGVIAAEAGVSAAAAPETLGLSLLVGGITIAATWGIGYMMRANANKQLTGTPHSPNYAALSDRSHTLTFAANPAIRPGATGHAAQSLYAARA